MACLPALVPLIFYPGQPATQYHMKEEKYLAANFKELEKQSKERQSLSDIELRFKIAQQQSVRDGGLAFMLDLINHASADILINNPLDYLQIIMQDEAGWPVNLPLTPSRIMINARGPVEPLRPFRVESIENSLGEANLMEVVNAEEMLLKAGAAYQFIIRIDTVMDTDINDRMTRTDKTKPIEKGKYRININLSILLAADKEVYRQSESGYLEVDLR